MTTNHAQNTFGLYTATEEFAGELAQMELVCDAGTGGCYDWDVFYAYYHTGRDRFYFISGSGCSCHWISDGVDSLGEFEDTPTKQELARHFREYANNRYGWHQNEIESTVREILDYRK